MKLATLQPWLAPLQLPYAAALALKNAAYAHGWLRSRALSWPVVSVGNLSVGGAGKTPFVIELAQLLTTTGIHVDVLTRGYGRRSPTTVEQVEPEGSAQRFGDEALLIARAAHVPVFVGTSRYEAGRLAEQGSRTNSHEAESSSISVSQLRDSDFEITVGSGKGTAGSVAMHLLDDGFQHRGLARTIEIVLVHPSDRTASLLPAGRLREPLRALRRADFVVLREGDRESERALQEAGINKPVWRVRRTLTVPFVDGMAATGRAAVAFCGIAHPDDFFSALRAQVHLQDTFAFGDHHPYSDADIERIAERAQGAAALLTTEKDLVRLEPAARARLERVCPLLAVPLRAELLDAERNLQTLLALVGTRST